MATVLIVDDELSIRRMLGYMLRRTQHTALLAGSGEEALAMLDAHTVDVLLLDIAMPLMDGLAVLQQLRATPAYHDLPVIVLTADTNEHKRIAALDAGADLYLNKLTRPEELLVAIDQVLLKTT